MTFDWMAATLAGFRVLGARMYALLFWTFTVVAAFGVGMFIWVRAGTAGLSMPMMQVTMLLITAPVMIFAFALVVCAVYRTVLRPQEKAFLGMRMGADELRVSAWLALVMLFVGA